MGAIFRENFQRLLRPGTAMLYIVLIGLGTAAGIWWGLSADFSAWSLAEQKRELRDWFTLLAYFWLAGIPLLFWLSIKGIPLLREEKRLGLSPLLRSKPLGQRRFWMGKLLALLAAALLLGWSGISVAGLLLALGTGWETALIERILWLMGRAALYLGAATLVFVLLTTAFSLSAKRTGRACLGLFLWAVILYVVAPLWYWYYW